MEGFQRGCAMPDWLTEPVDLALENSKHALDIRQHSLE